MCIIQAGYFTKNGSAISGSSCNVYANDKINEDIIATFSASELNINYVAFMKIKRPDNIIVEINTSPIKVTSTTETFIFADWATPIPNLGTFTILESMIYNDDNGYLVCSGNPSGGFCQALTVSAVPCIIPVCNFIVE